MNKQRYLFALALKALSLCSIFLAQVMMARLMSLRDFGFYGYAISIVNVASCFAIWGTDKFLVKRASLDLELGNLHSLSGTARNSHRTVFFNITVFSPFVLWILFARFPDRFHGSLAIIIYLFFLACTHARVSAAVARGLNHVLGSEFSLNCLRPISLIILAALYWAFGTSFSPPIALSLAACSFAVSAIATHWINRKHLASRVDGMGLKIRQVYSQSFPYFIIGIGVALLSNLDIILLGLSAGEEDVARYLASARISGLVTAGMVAANMLIAPKFPPLLATKQTGKLLTILKANNRFVALVTLLPILFLFTNGSFALQLFGGEYSEGDSLLRLLLVGPTITVMCGPSNLLCMMGKEQKAASLVFLFACLVEALACYFLIPRFGAHGAAWANLIAFVALNFALVSIVVRRVGINPTITNLLPLSRNP